MELLVILLGEFLFFPVIAVLGSALNLIISVFSFILLIIFDFIVPGGIKVKKQKKKHVGTISTQQRKSLPFKYITIIASSICLIVVVTLITANIFFFAQTVSWVTSQVAKKTNTEISFKSVEGSIFYGTIKFNSLQAKRENSTKIDFDVLVESLSLDVNIVSLITKPVVLEFLSVEGVKGDIWHKNYRNKASGKDIPKAEERKIKTKTKFVINDMVLTNIELKFNKEEMEPLVLSLKKIESRPFRSNYAIFDTFFRSKIEGSINGHRINIVSEEMGAGRKTTWHLDHFPVSIIKYFVQKAPISWFKSGTIDIRVKDEWEYRDNAEIEMDWNLQLNNIVMEVPKDNSLINKSLTFPIVNYINTKGDKIDLQFGLVMNENQFESTASLDAAGLWDVLVESLSEKLSIMTGEKKEMIKDGIQNGIDNFKNFLKNKTKK